jgi:hypothetical protein
VNDGNDGFGQGNVSYGQGNGSNNQSWRRGQGSRQLNPSIYDL